MVALRDVRQRKQTGSNLQAIATWWTTPPRMVDKRQVPKMRHQTGISHLYFTAVMIERYRALHRGRGSGGFLSLRFLLFRGRRRIESIGYPDRLSGDARSNSSKVLFDQPITASHLKLRKSGRRDWTQSRSLPRSSWFCMEI